MPPAAATEPKPKRCLVEGPLKVEPGGSTAFQPAAGIGATWPFARVSTKDRNPRF
jgi:hypothetical protein